jgi:hypothetical protein
MVATVATTAATLARYLEKMAPDAGFAVDDKTNIVPTVEEVRIGLTERAVASTTLTRAYILKRLHENMKRVLTFCRAISMPEVCPSKRDSYVPI